MSTWIFFNQNNQLLKELVENNCLFAFAEHLLIEVDGKDEAVAALSALGTFEQSGLKINKIKLKSLQIERTW